MVFAGGGAKCPAPQGRPGRPRSGFSAARPVPVRGGAGIGRVAPDRQRVCDPLQRPAALLPRAGDRRRAAQAGQSRSASTGPAGRADAALPAAGLRTQTGSGRNGRPAAIAFPAQHHGAAALRERFETAVASISQWTDTVPDSASDAYHWEVERAVDKRVVRPAVLNSEAAAAQALDAGRASAADSTPIQFKLFIGGVQEGPFGIDQLAGRIARREVTAATQVWDMRQSPRTGSWQRAGEV